jgi:hypothetical protein
MHHILNKINPTNPFKTIFSDFLGFKSYTTDIVALPRNFIDISNPYFYVLDEFDQELIDEAKSMGSDIPKAGNGQYDAVKALYENMATTPTSETLDPQKVTYATSDDS